MKRYLMFVLALLLIPTAASAQGVNAQASLPNGAQSITQLYGPNFSSPNFTYTANSLVVSYTGGTIYTPNGPVTVAPGSLTMTGSATTCARPSFTSCDFIYANSSGTMATTQSAVTASATAGSTVLAYVTTNSTGVLTLTTPWQDTSAPPLPKYQPVNPTSIYNYNQAAQSQVVVSATEYYITNSDLDMPAVYSTAIAAGTTLRWKVCQTKTAAGTGSYQILIKDGTNGSTADTTDATVTIGTQSAAADNMCFDLTITFTSATAYYYVLAPVQGAATTTGFGLAYPAAAAQFTGTVSGLTTTTASLKFGLSFKATTGTPTIVTNLVQAQAFGVN